MSSLFYCISKILEPDSATAWEPQTDCTHIAQCLVVHYRDVRDFWSYGSWACWSSWNQFWLGYLLYRRHRETYNTFRLHPGKEIGVKKERISGVTCWCILQWGWASSTEVGKYTAHNLQVILMRQYTGRLCGWDTDVFEHGDLGCLPENFNRRQKHKKMLISLKAMGCNSVFNFLKIPFLVCFSF